MSTDAETKSGHCPGCRCAERRPMNFQQRYFALQMRREERDGKAPRLATGKVPSTSGWKTKFVCQEEGASLVEGTYLVRTLQILHEDHARKFRVILAERVALLFGERKQLSIAFRKEGGEYVGAMKSPREGTRVVVLTDDRGAAPSMGQHDLCERPRAVGCTADGKTVTVKVTVKGRQGSSANPRENRRRGGGVA